MKRLFVLVIVACNGEGPPNPVSDAGPDADAGEGEQWSGPVEVAVEDGDGSPVEGAVVTVGGRPRDEWVTTGALGRASVLVQVDRWSDRWIAAGKTGWYSRGVELPDDAPPEGPLTIALERLPADDNVDYEFLESGYPGNDEAAEFCQHCHIPLGEQWNESAHKRAISNPRTRDLFNGSALEASEDECGVLGGRWEESGVPGSADAALEMHCIVDRGVLPDLNDGCGAAAETPCDHPLLDRGPLTSFGSCGDCHGPSIPRAVPGRVDLNAAIGFTYDEGVSCDLCHKIQDVVEGPAPGLDGAMNLLRPSRPSRVATLEWDPTQFGPYPDVLNPSMGASYNPLFREARLCSACHEHAQPALDPADAPLVDADRWPDGIPVQSTYAEWAASPFSPDMPCHECHMPAVQVESSTFDITPTGLPASTVDGWLRPFGEVRDHSLPSIVSMARTAVATTVVLEESDGSIAATATLRSLGAGHALPTGEPMRQVIVLVEAEVDGARVEPLAGRAVPDVGGWVALGVVGDDATVLGRDVTFTGATLREGEGIAVRFVRPTGRWDDYAGPGVGWFSEPERTPEEKGLAVHRVLGEVAVASVAGETATLAADPPAVRAGDVAYLVGEGDHAGAPGWLHAKVLVDRDGNRAVHHYRAVGIASDNRIPPLGSASTLHRFPVPAKGSTLRVTVRVVHRRFADAVAREYGWAHDDVEIGRAEAEWTP